MHLFHGRLTFAFLISSSFMHIFCCGLPLILSVTNVAAMSGLVGASTLHSGWFEQFEVAILIISGALLAFTCALQFMSWRIDCREDGACVHEPCDSKKRLSNRILMVAIALFAINLVVYFATHSHL